MADNQQGNEVTSFLTTYTYREINKYKSKKVIIKAIIIVLKKKFYSV